MKIGINATFLHEKPTGVCVFTREISRALAELHHDTVVFSPSRDSGMRSGYHHEVPKRAEGSTRLINNVFRMMYINAALPALCRVKNIDVLYCPITEYPFLSSMPMVVHVHDLHPLHFPTEFGLGAQRFRCSLQHIHRGVKRITVSSQFVKDELLSCALISEDSVDVIPLAYNSLIFKPQKTEGRGFFLNKYSVKEDYILFVGTLYPYKNVRTLIEAFLNIKHRIPHDLVIVGKKMFGSGAMVSEARIHYTDYVPAEDMPFFYSYADVFVHPSISEGFGLAPLEAMACGTPVISSNGGSLPEVLRDAGMLFDSRDTDSLSAHIMNVVTDRGLHDDLREKGFRNIERYSWEKTAAGILKACERVLSRQ